MLEKKYFPSVYIAGMFPPLVSRSILLSWLFNRTRMENHVSFRCSKYSKHMIEQLCSLSKNKAVANAADHVLF